MSKPLDGIRVLELTTFVAAPVSGRLLGDMGASVIKVERISGDDWRETAKSFNPRFNDDQNPVFDIYNSGKRCISLDLKNKDGMDVFMKLMAQADIFITNTRPQALKRLGIAFRISFAASFPPSLRAPFTSFRRLFGAWSKHFRQSSRPVMYVRACAITPRC